MVADGNDDVSCPTLITAVGAGVEFCLGAQLL